MSYQFAGADAPLARLVAVLRGASHIAQSHHWQTRGRQYYGDHLMFMRIYEQSQPGIDQVAERAVGTGELRAVSAVHQIDETAAYVRRAYRGRSGIPPADELPAISLAVERDVIEAIAATARALQASGELSSGTRAMLEALSDKHEQFVYLLTQRLRPAAALGRIA